MKVYAKRIGLSEKFLAIIKIFGFGEREETFTYWGGRGGILGFSLVIRTVWATVYTIVMLTERVSLLYYRST